MSVVFGTPREDLWRDYDGSVNNMNQTRKSAMICGGTLYSQNNLKNARSNLNEARTNLLKAGVTEQEIKDHKVKR